jgi:hypothetical protein
MSPPPSLTADSRIAPSKTGEDPTVNTEKTPPPSLSPSQETPTADRGRSTAKPSETYVDDYEFS